MSFFLLLSTPAPGAVRRTAGTAVATSSGRGGSRAGLVNDKTPARADGSARAGTIPTGFRADIRFDEVAAWKTIKPTLR